jgi:hypothetical protein
MSPLGELMYAIQYLVHPDDWEEPSVSYVAIPPYVSPELAARLGELAPLIAAPAALRVAERMIDVMSEIIDSDTPSRLAEPFGTVASRLEPPAAERIAERILHRMGTADEPSLPSLDAGFGGVLPWLTASSVERVAEGMVEAMGKISYSGPSMWLARLIRALPSRLAGRGTKRIAERTAEPIRRPVHLLSLLAVRLGELVTQLPPPAAKRVAERAAPLILKGMGRTSDSVHVGRVLTVLKALAPRAATPAVGQTALVLGEIPEAIESVAREKEAEGIGEAAPAPSAADRFTDAMREVRKLSIPKELDEGLAALAPWPTASNAEKLHDFIGKVYTESKIEVIKGVASAVALVADDCELRTTINMLKFPLCVGPLRDALLQSLERRTGMTFGGDLWSLVEQAEALGLGSDELSCPPVRSSG